MKVLFVSSGNNPTSTMAPFIKSQGDSLQNLGINVSYLLIHGKGLKSYLFHVAKVREAVRINQIDIIHAHYSLCAAICLMACSGKPVVASYMGNDAFGDIGLNGKIKFSSYWLVALSIIIQPFLSFIICKSENIKEFVFKKNSAIIPNGVDLDRFTTKSIKEKCTMPFIILFLGNPNDQRKNIALLMSSVKYLYKENIEVRAPYPVPSSEIITYLMEADMLAMCSLVEGSPNVVKEAMACGLPIVATNAGDAWWLLGDLEGHYKAGFDPEDFANGIKSIMNFKGITEGRHRLIELGLDSNVVANRIIKIYNSVLKRKTS